MSVLLQLLASVSSQCRKAFPSDSHRFAFGGITYLLLVFAGIFTLLIIGQVSPLMAQPTLLSGDRATTSPATASPLFPTLFSTTSARPMRFTPASTPYTPKALSCSINTACADAAWSSQISAVVNVIRGSDTCTGVLINNTRQDQTPYVLTAYHCGTPTTGQHVDWTIEFNYQSATCGDPTETPVAQTLTGATVVAAQGSSDDYVLLRLDEAIPASYDVDFAGWSLVTTPAQNGTVIGHPKGDIKKITYDDQAALDAGDYWLVTFDRGTIEAASSGAPLFNHNQQVIGLVRSAISIDHDACSGPGSDDNKASILFPKLSKIWTAGPAGEQLADFLDPNGTGSITLGTLAATGGGGGATPPVPSEIWINEINADTQAGSTTEEDEFIEIVGPAGTDLTNYQLDIYTCDANTATLASTYTLRSFTLPNDYNAFGLFVIGGDAVDSNVRHQSFDGSDALPDGNGLIVLKDASGTEVFDYQYDTTSGGQPDHCPTNRTTRSASDTPGEGTMGFASETPTAETLGTNALTASPKSSNFDGGQVLPVELTSFDAVLNGRTALLTWTTASETNNAGFSVMQSVNCEAPGNCEWQELVWIDGHGTTEAEQAYGFEIDNLTPGRHTFRLKQIDYDGTFAYSPEVEVVIEMASRFVMEAAYPNPFNPQATFRFAVSRAQTVDVAMYDMLGRRVAVLWSGAADAGRMQAVRIDGSGLPSGVYMVRAVGSGFAETQRVSLIK